MVKFNRKWPRLVIDFIKLYLQNCCIHGFRYIAQFMIIERLLWFSLLVVSIYYSLSSCLSSVNRFNTKSTIVGIERNSYKWTTPLPSVTVCPMDRLDNELFQKYCRENNIVSPALEEFRDFLENLANSTYKNFENIPEYKSVDDILDRLNIKPEHYMTLIYNLTKDMRFEEDNNKVRCGDGHNEFRVGYILTEYGLCYVCNSYLGEEYSAKYVLFGQYPDKLPSENTHKHGVFFNRDASYTLMGFPGPIDSFLHSSYDVMRLEDSYGYTDEGLFFDTEVEYITTEPDLETSTTITQRHCRFFHESNLLHFPYYTKHSCMQECRLNLAYEICKCIPHFYPNRIAHPKPVCSYQTLIKCFTKGHSALFQSFYESKDAHHSVNVPTCTCEQNCRDSVLGQKSAFVNRGSYVLLRSTGVNVIIRVWPKNRFRRQVIFSFSDLLVSIGGTAGLFLGFSVLGLVEFLYFFTLRLIWHIFGYRL